MRNAIYRFTIGSNTVHIIEHMDYLDGLQTQVALLRVCRQIYYEAIPLVLGLRQLVLGNYKVAGHGRRMKKVLDRMLKCPLSAYIGAMAFMIEKESAVVAGKKIKLYMWGNVKVEACRSQLQHELCEGRGSHTIEVKIGGRHE
ncbi:hypothetical protein N0V87_006182 [Didymella glomerata]|uniref:Uncharacterized protein n=1 Tax=Didymella glomerata TaxID=749621 RepID=A0A9W8WXF4_9PLEO|nr:hypothetical protein N0V87_006182 [Didymella glomerata]